MEWRKLGFFYELCEHPPRWRFVGSLAGLANLVAILDRYVQDPRNQTLSEHEHYGPYSYFKIQTAGFPGIDDQGVRGSLPDLARLRDHVAASLGSARAGQTISVGQEYAPGASYSLQLEVRDHGFDPAAEDLGIQE